MDKIKLAYVPFVVGVLWPVHGNTNPVVDTELFNIIDDINFFNKYRGTVAFRGVLKSLRKDLNKKETALQRSRAGNKCMKCASYKLNGFIQPLQIFAYECIPGIASTFANKMVNFTDEMPRMCLWVSDKWSKKIAPSIEEVTAARSIMGIRSDYEEIESDVPMPEASPPNPNDQPDEPAPSFRAKKKVHFKPNYVPVQLDELYNRLTKYVDSRMKKMESKFVRLLDRRMNKMESDLKKLFRHLGVDDEVTEATEKNKFEENTEMKNKNDEVTEEDLVYIMTLSTEYEKDTTTNKFEDSGRLLDDVLLDIGDEEPLEESSPKRRNDDLFETPQVYKCLKKKSKFHKSPFTALQSTIDEAFHSAHPQEELSSLELSVAKNDLLSMGPELQRQCMTGSYEKAFYEDLLRPGTWLSTDHMQECCRRFIHMQATSPRTLRQDLAIMDAYFSQLVQAAYNSGKKPDISHLHCTVCGTESHWPCVSWKNVNYILFVVHSNSHWITAKVDVLGEEIILYDSDHGCNSMVQLNTNLRGLKVIVPMLLKAVGVKRSVNP